MLRTTAPRQAIRSLQRANVPLVRASLRNNIHNGQWTSKICTSVTRRPQLALTHVSRPIAGAVARFQTSSISLDKIDRKAEAKTAQKKLKPTPETVSTGSSVHPVLGEVGAQEPERDVDMLGGIKHDLDTVKETFSLNQVPRQAYILGLAGVLPYLATSLSTVYCAWEVNHAAATGSGILLSEKGAELLLAALEPLQIGYGAVILSFLGAIHWGLEWAGYGGYHGYKRYAIGVVAPAIAWPTILLPPVYALITQFIGFVWLYYVDARATVRGWTPSWYGTYRFVLTFIVGASIVVSLIGRGEITNPVQKLPSATDRMIAFRDNAARELAEKEEAKASAKDKEAEEAKAREEEKEDSEGDDKEQDSEGEGDGESDGKEGKDQK